MTNNRFYFKKSHKHLDHEDPRRDRKHTNSTLHSIEHLYSSLLGAEQVWSEPGQLEGSGDQATDSLPVRRDE